MKPKIPILVLISILSLHCSYYGSPDGGQNDSGGDLPPSPCQSHQDCREDQRCMDGACLDEPPPCGVPGPPGCAWGLKDPQECDAAGGWIECSYLDPTWCWCECPSGDGDCPCWQAFHCQGHCVGDFENCIKAQIGKCSHTQATIPLGCNCVAIFETDSFEYICAD